MTRVLVIGGSGFVGEAAGRALSARGFEAISASRREVGPAAFDHHVSLDRRDGEALKRTLDEVAPDVVLDLACYQPIELRAVLRFFRGRRYVFGSAQNVYAFDGKAVVEEDFVQQTGEPMAEVENPLSDGGLYTLGKQWCETLLEQSSGFPYVTLRLPAIFGRHDHTTRIVSYMQRIDDGGPLLVPAESIDLLTVLAWVDDIGRASAAACELDREIDGAAFNLAYDDLTGRQFLLALAEAMGCQVELVAVPTAEIPAVASVYGPHPGLPGSVTRRAQEKLDFRPTPIVEALRDLVAWFREEHPVSPFYVDREAEVELALRIAD